MAGTALSTLQEFPVGSQVELMRQQLNQVIADLELMRSKFSALLGKLDLDTGVADSNYTALENVTAAQLLAAVVNVHN